MHHGENLLWLWWIHAAKQTAWNLRGLSTLSSEPLGLPLTHSTAGLTKAKITPGWHFWSLGIYTNLTIPSPPTEPAPSQFS